MGKKNRQPVQQELNGELLLKIVLVIFVVEILIMAIMPMIPLPDSRFIEALADATLLSLFSVMLLAAWVKTDRLFSRAFKSRYLLLFSLYALPAIGLLGAMTYLSYGFQSRDKIEQAFVQHENAMHEAAHELSSYFNGRIDELMFLKHHLHSYFEEDASAHGAFIGDHTGKLFADYIAEYEQVEKIRLIDKNGFEVIRLDKNNGGTHALAGQLQDKSNRDYVQEGLSLEPGQVYFSPINLSREFGKVELPVKPVLRAVVPVYSGDELQYLIVLNWKVSRLFEHLRHYSTPFIQQQITDAKGHWVLATNPEHEWGSDIVERARYGIAYQHQDLWEKIQRRESGFFGTGYSTIKAGMIELPRLVSIKKNLRAFDATYQYYIISELTDAAAEKIVYSLQQSHLYLFLLALPFILLATWLMLLMKLSQIHANQQIVEHAQQLEKKVSERTADLQIALENEHRANEAKSEFLANMSHELRTPMDSILRFSKIALKKTNDEKLHGYLEKIHISGERLTRLLNDLLDLAKLEAGKMALDFLPRNMKKVIESVIGEMNPICMEKGIQLTLTVDGDAVAVFDRDRMTQVIYNLLSNAVKFSPDKSIVEIHLYRKQILNEDYLELTVTDEGPGIPAGELKQVFDKFEQSSKTVSKAGGTGLGLAICQQIMNAHQGSIWAESPPPDKQHGSHFVIQLPCEQAG